MLSVIDKGWSYFVLLTFLFEYIHNEWFRKESQKKKKDKILCISTAATPLRNPHMGMDLFELNEKKKPTGGTDQLSGTWVFGGSAGKESACNAGDLSSIPGLGKSPGEGNSYPL